MILPELAGYPLDVLADVYRVNVFGPLALLQLVLPLLGSSNGAVLDITSDAGVEAYEGWGGYGASKAALEHLSRILAAPWAGIFLLFFLMHLGRIGGPGTAALLLACWFLVGIINDLVVMGQARMALHEGMKKWII